MATVTTKFAIGDTFYTFDPDYGVITPHVAMAIGISAVGGLSGLTMAPEITYRTTRSSDSISESDTLTSQEATTTGNAWLASKSTSMFTSAGL